MILHLIATPAERATLGPADWYRLDGGALREGAGGTVLARYDGERWSTGESHFVTIVCEGPVSCHFERGLERRDNVAGPFASLMLVDGVLWADDTALARFDGGRAVWRLLSTEEDYRAISWRAALQRPEPDARTA